MAEEFQGFNNDITPLAKPDPADYPGAYDPKDDIEPSLEKPGSIPLPLPGAGQPGLASTDDIKNAVRNLNQGLQAAPENPWTQAKTQKFNAGIDGLQFERYYNHPQFKALGFTPFRDNETLYNENSNVAHDAIRAWSQFGKVAGLGFADAAGFGSLTDIGTAKDYEKAMAIGSSSREGVGGFTTNLFMNSAYTVGIIGETMLEELGLALITGASGLTASEVTIPLMISRGLRASNKIHTAYNVGKNILKTLDSLKDMNKARKYFTEAAKGTGRFLNPMEESVKFLQGMDKIDNLRNMAKTAHGFASFYKDVRNVRLAWGEAGLEGGMVRNDLEEELLNAHMEKFGKAPTKEEAERIKDIALQGGMSTAYQNIFAIYYSNKIVFDNLFKGFRPAAKWVDEGLDFGPAGKVVQGKTKDPLRPYKHLKKDWKSFKEAVKDPLTYSRTALGYFKANVAEGLQETTQEVISGASTDAAMREWEGNSTKGSYLAAVADNIEKQMTPEGLEVFLSGFLMGGMIQPVTKAPSYATQKWQQFRDPVGYKKQKQDQQDYINETVNTLNDLYENAADVFEPNLDNLSRQHGLQKGMAEAQSKGDAKRYYDLKDESQFDAVWTALKHGRLGSFVERLEDMKGLSPEEIKQEYGMEQADWINRLDKTIANTKRIEQRYEVAQETMSNPHDPNVYQKGSMEQQEALINKKAWDNALQRFVFLQESFDRNLERKAGILGEVQKDTGLAKVATSEFAPLFNIADATEEIRLLDEEIKSLEGATGEVRKQRIKKERKRKLLKQFADRMTDLQATLALKGTEGAPNPNYAAGQAKKAYKQYLKYLADVNKDHLFNNNVDKSFQNLVEHYELDKEGVDLNDAVNKLLDPGTFTREVARAAKLEELRVQQRQKELRGSLDAYVKQLDTQRLMQLLYDDQDRDGKARRRMFFDPEQLTELLENGKMPTKFYYASEKATDEIVEVPRNSNDFREAIGIIAEFVPNLMDIQISEQDLNSARNQYDSKARPKKKSDKRTYDDIAQQFGFDPKADETKIELGKVLDAIIASPYASKDEVYLAKELKKKVSAGETVTFTKTASRAGSYSPSTQTVIDARYGSSNYQNQGLPIEQIILHEEIHRRTVEEIELDPEFRKKMEDLYEVTRTHFEANKDKEAATPYGLASVQEFISEAMTNNEFQKQLAEIPVEVTGAPVWNKFVDAVLKMLKDAFGRSISNSVLNEAMNIITTKIDSRFVSRDTVDQQPIKQATQPAPAPAQAAEVERTPENTKITQKIRKVDLLSPTHKKLADDLLTAYKAENKGREESAQDVLDPDWDTKTDDELLDSNQFERYYKAPRSAVQAIFNKYNEDTGRIYDPLLEPVSDTNAGVAIKDALKAKGYTTADIEQMTVPEQVDYANDPQTKAERLASIAADIAGEDAARAKQKAKIRKDVEELISSANSLEELEVNREKINEVLNERQAPNAPSGRDISELKAEELDKMYNDRLKELAFSFTYDDIMTGATIELKNKKKMYITEKTDNKLIGHKVGVPTEIIVINKGDIQQQVRYVVTPAAIAASLEGLPSELTPADPAISAQNNDNVADTDNTIDNDWNSTEDGEDANPGCR